MDELHKRGIRVILDYSWNHTGTNFWAWLDILKNQANSKYKDWYEISTFDNPDTPENEFSYKGWYGNAYMPELKKVNITTPRVNGLPYEGNINDGAKQHIFDVTKRWLAPDGDISKGIDGYRLDVAEQIGMGFWRDYRLYVKSINPEAYLVGEIWWQQWPKKLMDPAPYMKGNIFDAVMYYQVYKPARSFFVNTDDKIDARQFRDSLEYQWNRIPEDFVYAMMNVSSTHDAPRLLTDFYNTNAYKYHANPNENPLYKTGKPDKEAYERLRLYLVHLFTTKGSPQIWNGDEMGMWGADDPNCRKPLMWPELKMEKEYRNNFQPGEKSYDKIRFDKKLFEFYKKLIRIRKDNPVLSLGEFSFTVNEGKKLGYTRSDDKNEIVVLFNMEDYQGDFKLPEGNFTDLLSGKNYGNRNIRLKPMKAVILKKSDK
ncbi:MAG: alpha-amylase [Bacteroidetes bacterium]|nr:alpha-amylase [Bacteroidota bacterium]